MDIKVSFQSSKKISPSLGAITIGKYTIEPLPDSSPGADSATTRYLLKFEDTLREQDDGASQPEGESRLFLSYLALALGSRINIGAMMINTMNAAIPSGNSPYAEYSAVIEDLPDFNALASKLSAADPKFARQFFRACDVYRTAVNLMGENNTFSYFLLTIAVECLSNNYGEGRGSCDKFVSFILTHNPDTESLSETDWKEFLKEIYYSHRSGFTHGGKPIPEAAALADRLNRVYVRNIIDGKEIRTPGLKWFDKVVRRTLLAFLLAQPQSAGLSADHFKDISLEFGRVILKAAREPEAYTIVQGPDFVLH